MDTILSIVRVRVELFATEAKQAGDRMAMLAIYAVLSFLLLAFALVLGAMVVVVAFWDTPYRLAAAVTVAAIPAIAGALCVLVLVGRTRKEPRMFDSTLSALECDLAVLR